MANEYKTLPIGTIFTYKGNKFFDSLKDYKYGVERHYYKLNNN